jgi:NhaP-type Na+/H+ or K+/H+ antiporter
VAVTRRARAWLGAESVLTGGAGLVVAALVLAALTAYLPVHESQSISCAFRKKDQ